MERIIHKYVSVLALIVLATILVTCEAKAFHEPENKEIYIGEWINTESITETLLACDTKEEMEFMMESYEENFQNGLFVRSFYESILNEKGDLICDTVTGDIKPQVAYNVYKVETPNGYRYYTVFKFELKPNKEYYGTLSSPIVENPIPESEPPPVRRSTL